MTRSVIKKLAVATALLSIGLLFTRFVWLMPTAIDNQHFDEKVNLALRRTAHYLLVESGDSTSRIAPVQNRGEGTFMIRLENSFNYDRLPVLLQESLQLHDIQVSYDVAVLNCLVGDLLLGYNVQDVQPGQDVPCRGREQQEGCYDLQVTFASPQSSPLASAGWWILASGFLLGGISYAAWQWATRNKNLPTLPPVDAAEPVRLPFGASSLDVANQTLLVGSVQHQLTYRETKLLHFFVSHLGQLLERDFILQSVWQDEGIIVGRSVDVFVSRLRKMLRDDATIRIATVHGVGYRLEAQGE